MTTDDLALRQANAAMTVAVAASVSSGTNGVAAAQSTADAAFSIAVAGTNAAAPFTTYGTTSATHQFYGTTAEGVMQGHTLVFLNGLLQSWTTV